MLERANRLLAAFGEDIDLVAPHVREASLQSGQVLWEPGDRIRKVYFLRHGIVSKLAVFEDGTEIECAIVGSEGAVGAMSVLGLRTAVTRDVCHLSADASVIDVAVLQNACRASERIHDVLDRYCVWKMEYAIRNGACNACHSVEQRLGRWLLTCSDVTQEDDIRLTQDVFAKMLGVQRTSVNPILQKFRREGLISLARSQLTITNRRGLVRRACECYRAMPPLEAETPVGVAAGMY